MKYTYTNRMKYTAIAFSGGYDSTYFLKILCQNRIAYKYILIIFYIRTKSKYSFRHMEIAQIAYQWNIKFVIAHEKSEYGSTKQKKQNIFT